MHSSYAPCSVLNLLLHLHFSALQSCNFARLLIHSCCFPAVSAQRQLEAATLGRLNAAGAEAASVSALPPPPLQQSVLAAAATAEATAERCIAAAQAQYGNGSGTSSREAAFDLLLDLMLHDSGCWQYAQEQLRNIVHAAASSFLPQRFNNMPLQSLRTPGRVLCYPPGQSCLRSRALLSHCFHSADPLVAGLHTGHLRACKMGAPLAT